MNIGSLYQIKKWYWLLYPSKDIAVDAAAEHLVAARGAAHAAAAIAAAAHYWSKLLDCNVMFIPENSMFVLLEQDGKYCKILSTNGEIGWIIYPEDEDWTKGCIEAVKP